MPKKCYNKPDRKNPRYFKPCDVARIAQNCVEDNNYPPELVLAYVAKYLGFSHIALQQRKGIDVSDERRSGDSALLRQLEEFRDSLDKFLKRIGLDV